ncbi:hypothetical protein CHS0354_001057 [Potamilus streckersoni]|uniref:Uncharacterized protein n=1 Tax=Potamilus streckersoni TaxID=2493646 RepID=A0AAE0SUA1_9BIVA|nr:hypothetical protein CHS0354_001057 [Potamilus streckersoni]
MAGQIQVWQLGSIPPSSGNGQHLTTLVKLNRQESQHHIHCRTSHSPGKKKTRLGATEKKKLTKTRRPLGQEERIKRTQTSSRGHSVKRKKKRRRSLYTDGKLR